MNGIVKYAQTYTATIHRALSGAGLGLMAPGVKSTPLAVGGGLAAGLLYDQAIRKIAPEDSMSQNEISRAHLARGTRGSTGLAAGIALGAGVGAATNANMYGDEVNRMESAGFGGAVGGIIGMAGGTLLSDIDLVRRSRLSKLARVSTSQEREKSRQYRQQNRAKVRLAAKRRKRRQDAGIQLKKSRVGTAAGGYSFVMSSPGGRSGGHGSGGKLNLKVPSDRHSFPVNVASSHQVRPLGR